MNIVCYTLAWNEEFILPYFLHHYDFCDKIVIHDNGSDDRTVDLLLSNPKVECISFDTDGQQDNEAMTWLKNNCWKGTDADYVIVCDIDEFLIPNWDALECNRSERVAFQATGWDMVGHGEPLDEIARAFQNKVFNKVVIFNPAIDRIGYLPGAHCAEPSCPVINAMELRHYNMLSFDYMAKRWSRYASRMSEQDISKRWGRHYRFPKNRMRTIYKTAEAQAIDVSPLKDIYQSWRLNG